MGIRVLVVEDEAAIADFVTRGLREEGFTVEHAADGEAGRQALLRGGRWDVVLLDWWLPGHDGLTLLRQLRKEDRLTPVLFLTARDAISDRVRGLDAGADDYLCKPFAFEELLARVRALSRRREGGNAILQSHGVQLDLATQRADRAGQALDLTAKEQSLLLFFLRHPDEVLSRTRIYEQVWEERFDGVSNTLEVHVMELRRKLEAHGPRLIHTFRNRGYLFGKEPAASREGRR
jgi:two-component system, OmpR family, copper resistance phosphate regulon response regulator CusR